MGDSDWRKNKGNPTRKAQDGVTKKTNEGDEVVTAVVPRQGAGTVANPSRRVLHSGPRPLIFKSSTSNLSAEFGGMTGGKPRLPYAWRKGECFVVSKS